MNEITQHKSSSAEVLKSFLQKKNKKNNLYSLRAFARDLGISPAFVTQILNGKKRINVSRAVEIAKALKLTETEKSSLVDAVFHESGIDLKVREEVNYDALVDLSKEEFIAVANWYHFAILDLVTTENFQSDTSWIAKKLGISVADAEMGLARLLKIGLLIEKDGTIKKANRQVRFSTKVSIDAVREHHNQMMDRAKKQLERTDENSFNKRMICSITCAADPRKIEEARKRVLDFQQELANFLSADEGCEEVYQFNIQLFPHTN